MGGQAKKSKNLIETLLLLALPASGKSEVRKYLSTLTATEMEEDFGIGESVQLDDFPWGGKGKRIFFEAADKQMTNTYDWGTLIQLVNEDYEDLVVKKTIEPEKVALYYFDRIDKAGEKVGIKPRLANLEGREEIAKHLEEESKALLKEKIDNYPDTLLGKTLVIEFARGGPDKSVAPLPTPLGYQYSLSQLSDNILENSRILYVWVTPEESRRKNDERTDPNDPGSILNHGVPIEVMLGDYGMDDMDYLEKDGFVEFVKNKRTIRLPISRFDNRKDKTSFIRKDVEKWTKEEIKGIHEGLKNGLSRLAKMKTEKIEKK